MSPSHRPGRLVAALRAVLHRPPHVRDPRPSPGYYDGTETPDQRPPNRYARGERAVPAPPPTGM